MPIVVVPHPALRKTSKEIKEADFDTAEMKKLLSELSEALASRDDGVGLSAPQIGINKRVFVVAGKVSRKKDEKNIPPDEYFINPIIIKVSKKLSNLEEGCLSIPNTYGMVKRPANVKMEYTDEMGEKKSKSASGLLARIFQHEIDHLDGILFIDKATNIKELKNTDANTEY